MSTERIEEFLTAVKAAFAGNMLVGLKLGGYHGGANHGGGPRRPGGGGAPHGHPHGGRR